MIRYVVKDEGERISGTAEDVLQRIIDKNPDSEIGTMTPTEYANELMHSIYRFLTEDKAESILKTKDEPTFDKALRILDAAPTSGTTIMSQISAELEGAGR